MGKERRKSSKKRKKSKFSYSAKTTSHRGRFCFFILVFSFSFASFKQKKLEPGDGSNELPAGSPLQKRKRKEDIYTYSPPSPHKYIP